MNLLDQLFAEAAATAKKMPNRGQMTPVIEPTPESEYLPEKIVALFNRVHCSNCGAHHQEFEGLFEVRKHIRKLESHWVKQPTLPAPGLPRTRAYREVKIEFCANCIDIESYKEET